MTDDQFPRRPEALTAEWLSAVLCRKVETFRLEPLGFDTGNLGELVLVEIDGVAQLVAKFGSDRPEARTAAKRSGLFEREVSFYRDMATEVGVAPRCYAAEYDPETADFVVVLDYLRPDRKLDTLQGVGQGQMVEVLELLAKLHETGLGHVSRTWLQPMTHQPRIDNLRALVRKGWPMLVELCDADFPASRGAEVPDRLESSLRQLAQLPQTVVHGDAKPDNMVLSGGQLHLLDWQAVGSGPPAWDVAYALIQCLTTQDRRTHGARLIDGYPHDLAGIELCWVMGLVVAAALPVLGNPKQPRVAQLARVTAERAIAAMSDDGLW